MYTDILPPVPCAMPGQPGKPYLGRTFLISLSKPGCRVGFECWSVERSSFVVGVIAFGSQHASPEGWLLHEKNFKQLFLAYIQPNMNKIRPYI